MKFPRLKEARSTIGKSLDLGLARTAAAVLVARVAAAGAQFTLTFAIARALGAEVSGFYYLAFSVASIGAIIASLGLGTATMRFIATAASQHDWRQVAGIHRQGALVTGLASACVAGVIAAFAPFLATTVFDEPQVEPVIRIAALLVPALTLLALYSQILKAIHRPFSATALQAVGPPAAATVILLSTGTNSAIVTMAILLTCTLGFLAIEVAQWITAIGKPVRQWGQFDLSLLLRTSLPLLVVSSMSMVITWSDVVVIGVLRTSEEVGTYAPAARTALLISLGLVAIGAVVQPRLAVLHSTGDFKGLEHLARNTSLLGTIVGFPAFLAIEFAAPWFMGLFGAEFEAGATALRILVIGQFLNVLVGTTGLLLSMSGRERILQRSMVIGAAANIILNVALVPLAGINGAAIATSLSLGGINLANLVSVRKTLDIQPIFALRSVQH